MYFLLALFGITLFNHQHLNARQPAYIQKRKEFEKINPMTVRLSSLGNGFCIPCHGGVKPLSVSEQENLLLQIPQWKINRSEKIPKLYQSINFSSFAELLKFLNALALIAEREKHHPDIHISYNRLTLKIYTHALNGLSLNDYVLAAKISNVQPSIAHEKILRPQTHLPWKKNLDTNEVTKRITKVPRWNFLENPYHKLVRKTEWKNFVEAMHFVNYIANYAASTKYYPDISIYYNQVTIELYSRLPSRQLRDYDIAVARKIEKLIRLLTKL